MKQICFIILLFTALKSYSKGLQHSGYLQVGGSGLMISGQYERLLTKHIGLHAGIGIYGREKQFATYPLGINYLLPIKSLKSSLDIGYTATYSKADVILYILAKKSANYQQTNFWNHVPHLSLRRVTKHNLLLRAGLAPVINHWGFLPYIEMSIGKSF